MHILRSLCFITPLVLAGCNLPSIITKADDPAILVCEEIIKLGLVAPKTYERVTARVEGLTANVSYDAMNPAGVPIRHVQGCVFEQNRKTGEFELSTAWVGDGADEKLEELKIQKTKAAANPNYEERHAALKAIETEAANVSKKFVENMSLHLSYVTIAMTIAGYPIPPEQTELASDPAILTNLRDTAVTNSSNITTE